MATFQPATDPLLFGIAPAHWEAIIGFVRDKGYLIAVRGGKKAAVPWIELGFPAKPLDFKKCKVDPKAGLLMADNPERRAEAERGGFPVLEAVPGQPTQFVGRLQAKEAFAGYRFNQTRDSWAQAGLILDPAARLPITSDYDLAAIVDTEQPDYFLTYGSVVGSASSTNAISSGIVNELNRRFGSRRIMHGTEAQYSGSLANGDDEQIVVFRPGVPPESFAGGARLSTDAVLHQILLHYFPEMAVMFRQ
jgi:hypothetical protein